MKNPYDSYLMRKDKPKVIGFYCGSPVYDDYIESCDFKRMKRDMERKERHLEAMKRFLAINNISVESVKGEKSTKSNTAFACLCMGLLLVVLWQI